MRREIDGVSYRVMRLSAFDAWRLYGTLSPLIPAFTGIEYGIAADQAAFAQISRLSDDALITAFARCRAACERLDDDAWGPVPETLSTSSLVSLVVFVAQTVFEPLTTMERAQFQPVSRDVPDFEPVAMPHNDDWLFRPVLRGLCHAESLYDGTLTLDQVAKLNDALNVADENEARVRKAMEKST